MCKETQEHLTNLANRALENDKNPETWRFSWLQTGIVTNNEKLVYPVRSERLAHTIINEAKCQVEVQRKERRKAAEMLTCLALICGNANHIAKNHEGPFGIDMIGGGTPGAYVRDKHGIPIFRCHMNIAHSVKFRANIIQGTQQMEP